MIEDHSLQLQLFVVIEQEVKVTRIYALQGASNTASSIRERIAGTLLSQGRLPVYG